MRKVPRYPAVVISWNDASASLQAVSTVTEKYKYGQQDGRTWRSAFGGIDDIEYDFKVLG